MAACGLSVLARAEPAIPVPSAAKLERLTEFFQNEVATGKLAGVIVLIQQHGRPVYLKCFGLRDVATRHPMTPDTAICERHHYANGQRSISCRAGPRNGIY